MYCSNCGTKNTGNNFCISCGNRLDEVNTNINVMKKDNNGSKVASIILGVISIFGSIMIVLSPVSIILSIIGLVLGIDSRKKGTNVLGIVLNIIGLILSIGMLLLICLFINWAVNLPDEYNDSYYEEIYDYFGNDREYY